eukprot:gene24721-biopygen19166
MSSQSPEASEAPVYSVVPCADDALWICQTDLLRCFDSETRGIWRLAYATNQAILQQCPVLEKDITALSASSNLQKLDISGCMQLLDIRGLSACSNLHKLDLPVGMEFEGITALSASTNSHVVDLAGSELRLQLEACTASAEFRFRIRILRFYMLCLVILLVIGLLVFLIALLRS